MKRLSGGIDVGSESHHITILDEEDNVLSNAKLTIYDELEGKALAYTQFSRAMQELSIGMVYAYSPQAKGFQIS